MFLIIAISGRQSVKFPPYMITYPHFLKIYLSYAKEIILPFIHLSINLFLSLLYLFYGIAGKFIVPMSMPAMVLSFKVFIMVSDAGKTQGRLI